MSVDVAVDVNPVLNPGADSLTNPPAFLPMNVGLDPAVDTPVDTGMDISLGSNWTSL
jgi:hypothetical protein